MDKEREQRNKGYFTKILAAALLADILVWLAVWEFAGRDSLEVVFFNVGQGDAALVRTPSGADILIDGGPGLSVLEGLGEFLPFWDRDIELMVLTHPDHDHLAGLLEALKRYRVKRILWTGAKKDNAEFKEWVRLIDAERCGIDTASAGAKLVFEGEPGFYMEVVYPEQNLAGVLAKDTNGNSLVLKLVYKERSFLFTGDIYGNIADELAAGDFDLRSDVLKIAHHGSKNSDSIPFLEKVSPAAAVISVGSNSYGHPAQETLEMLEKYDIKLLRTDMAGDIKFTTDGHSLSLITEN